MSPPSVISQMINVICVLREEAMLRRLRIGGRVNLLIALPMLALAVLATASLWAIQRSGFDSPEYQRLKLIEQLRSDVVPPYATLSEAWLGVNHIAALALGPGAESPGAQANITDELNRIGSVRGLYSRSLLFWGAQDLDPVVRDSLLSSGTGAGSTFYEIYDARFVPAVKAGDLVAIESSLRSIGVTYEAQTDAVARAAAFVDEEVVAQEAKVSSFVDTAKMVLAVSLISLLILTMLLAWVVRRSIVKPIKALAQRARIVATEDLPDAVREVSLGNPLPAIDRYEGEERGELADLGRSFSSVQEAALDLAAEQARARRVVSENLVNIARRNQSLLGRTLGFISELENSERDPQALDNLFRLDHLATRMRRNAQSLLVLADAEPIRRFAAPVPIGDVVRAALSEVENYGQVDLGDLGDGFLQGALVPEVAHLLAELIENATAFSPPSSRVSIVGRVVEAGHQLVIIDHGIGMSPDELDAANARLSNVTAFDRESNRMLGFHVVSRLAVRHKIKVMLTGTPGGNGTTAIVRLPSTVLDDPSATPSSVSELPRSNRPLEPATGPRLAEKASWIPATLAVADRPAISTEELRDIVEGPAEVVALAPPAAMPESQPISEMPFTAAAEAAAMHLPPRIATPQPTEVTNSGLTRRVRGAQMPDVGTVAEEVGFVRPAEEVRVSLASLQRGVDLGRINFQSGQSTTGGVHIQPSDLDEGEAR